MNRVAVILAGGVGSRLKPFTITFPKPLMPIGDRPILEIVLRQLKLNGFTEATLAVNHLAELIMAFCHDGSRFGVRVHYSREDQPLGTAGPLGLIHGLPEHFLVMNGDVLTSLDYDDFFKDHLRSSAEMTICTHQKKVKIDLGVLETDSKGKLSGYVEKPEYQFQVSTGIYVLARSILDLIPKDKRFDLPDLVREAMKHGRKVNLYQKPIRWLDIGRPEDYELATQEFESHRKEYLPE